MSLFKDGKLIKFHCFLLVLGNVKMDQLTSSEPKAEKASFPWNTIIFTLIWLVFAYYSVTFPHKTFHLASLEVPMTPLLLFFAASLILLVDEIVIEKEDFGIALVVSLFFNFLVFLPLPISWFLLSFYEVSTLPSFLTVLIVPAIALPTELRDWSKSRKTEASLTSVRGMSKSIKLMGFYITGLFFGYGTIISVSYFYCYFTNQSFETFTRANPAVILLGGATIMAGILALSRPSR